MRNIPVISLTGIYFFSLVAISVAQTHQVPSPINVGRVVVTPSRMAQSNYKITGNVTVLTKEEIDASGAQTVPDILRQAFGVHVYDNSTSKTAVVDIRGFGDTAARNVLVLVNDRKINNVDISGPDLVQIPLESVERIEIIHGAGSVLYGDNAVGGVVNIITKRGKGPLSGKIGATYGNYDARSTDLQVSGDKNNVSYYFYSQYLDERGYRSNSDLLAKDFNARLGYDFSDRLTTDLNIGYHDDDYGLPGGLTDTQLQTLGRRGSANEDDFAKTKDRFVQLTTNLTPWPEDVYYGTFSLDLNYRNRDVYDAFFSFGEFSTKRNIDTSGINAKYIFNRPVFDKDVNFVAGIDIYDTENEIKGSGSNVDDVTISKDEFGAYGVMEYEALNNFFVSGGGRYHRANFAFSQRNVAIDQKQEPDEFVSSGGLKYEYADGSNVFFNAQQTFRFLATDEWYSTANFPGFGITPGLNLSLKQQTGMQYETGIKHNFDEKVIVSVTPYWIDLKNEIFFDPVTFANSNYDKTRRVGVEVGQQLDVLKFVDIGFLDKLKFYLDYTYQNARFNGGTNDEKFIPGTPRYQVGAGFNSQLLDHVTLSLNSRYVGAQYPINDTLNQTSMIKPYFVVDSKIGYKRDPFEIYVSINNMFNELYSTYVAKSTFSSTKSHFPAPERNFIVGVNVDF